MIPSHPCIDCQFDRQHRPERAGVGTVPGVRKVTPWKNNAQGNVQHERNINMKILTGLIVSLLVCTLAGIGVAGCNTLRGAGKDIQKGGQAVERAADNAQPGNQDPRPHTIKAIAESGGSIHPSGRTRVPRGSSQTFVATANTGYRVTDVFVDGRSVGALPDLYHDDSSSYTFNNVAANHMISASFDANTRR